MLVKQYEVGNFAIFCYLIGDEESQEGLFIDPADDANMLLAEAKSHGLNKIKYIVNTHSHIDHIMGNAEMAKKTGAKIVIHEEDAAALVGTPPYMLEMFSATASPPADSVVKEGDLIQVGNVKLKVIHTPGHSAGGICLYLDGMVFTGDTLFVGSVGRTDFPGSSWEVLEASIRQKLYVLPGETVVFPGHNYGSAPTTTIQYERRHNPFVRG
ncbi:MAG TPA: MBL fold metallo-hydrolase [Thermodesulfobacteriota bacterium]|nr:MBL fold metallo-hydrolase [Thermodesulfobacteriota bacterium]